MTTSSGVAGRAGGHHGYFGFGAMPYNHIFTHPVVSGDRSKHCVGRDLLTWHWFPRCIPVIAFHSKPERILNYPPHSNAFRGFLRELIPKKKEAVAMTPRLHGSFTRSPLGPRNVGVPCIIDLHSFEHFCLHNCDGRRPVVISDAVCTHPYKLSQ